VAGHVLGFLIAVIFMARINLTITLLVFLPLAGTVVLTRLAWSRILRYRHASRMAGGRVTAFLGELFGAVQAVKVADRGKIYWNGKPVTDPARFFRPPRCAYTGQVPRLFSQTMRENILLSLPEDQGDHARALWQVVLGAGY
jgi:ABC-type multidrug transport system fused ATPase/permease subunit